MKIIIKKLQGGECCLDVHPSTLVSDMKKEIALNLGIPAEEQKLLHLGRTLADDQAIQTYSNIKDGTRLNLVVKKPEGFSDIAMKYYKSTGMLDTEAKNATNCLLKLCQEKFNQLSWDDIERLSLDCILTEGEPIEHDPTVEENLGNKTQHTLHDMVLTNLKRE